MEVSSFVKILEAAFLEDEMSTTLKVRSSGSVSAEIIREIRDAEVTRTCSSDSLF